MPRRALRAALFAIVTIALWALARPAMAMPAGYCDDRGATAMAPAPVLEAPDVAVRQARAAQAPAPACDGEDTTVGEAVVPGHGAAFFAAAQGEPALPSGAIVVPPASSESTSSAPEVARPSDGVTSGVDRPPRA
jgi:hypothetical protein